MWKKPWGLREGSAIVIGLILVGLMLQLSIGPVMWEVFLWPANIITLIAFTLILIVVYALRKRAYAFRFITSGAAAIPAIAAVVVLTLIMGITRQVPEGKAPTDVLGLSNCLRQWSFVLAYEWLTIIVGEVAILQLHHFSLRRLPSLLSHLGLYIVLTCATLGSADMQRLKMFCEQGNPEWRALDKENNVHELDIAIQLDSFTIDEYPPKLVIINSQGIPLPNAKKPDELAIENGTAKGTLCGYSIKVKKYLELAAPQVMAGMLGKMPEGMMGRMRMDSLGQRLNQHGYVPYTQSGAACAMLIEVSKGSFKKSGWVSCGSYLFPYQALPLDGGLQVVVPQRDPERYVSRVEILTQDGKHVETDITVNHPFSINEWKVYQLSYNEQMGRWSNLSIFELVTDPWLPAVYVGILLLAIGALGMFLTTDRRKEAKA